MYRPQLKWCRALHCLGGQAPKVFIVVAQRLSQLRALGVNELLIARLFFDVFGIFFQPLVLGQINIRVFGILVVLNGLRRMLFSDMLGHGRFPTEAMM